MICVLFVAHTEPHTPPYSFAVDHFSICFMHFCLHFICDQRWGRVQCKLWSRMEKTQMEYSQSQKRNAIYSFLILFNMFASSSSFFLSFKQNFIFSLSLSLFPFRPSFFSRDSCTNIRIPIGALLFILIAYTSQ